MKSIKSIVLLIVIIGTWLKCNEKEDLVLRVGSGDFVVTNGNVSISGTLFLPENKPGPFPVIILVPGSGEFTRDEGLPFVELFNSIGFATVIYDKRGTGKSTGEQIIVSIENSIEKILLRASDVNSIINLLKNHLDIATNKIGLIGSSQGAWVTSAVYDNYENVDFIVNTIGGVASVGLSDYYDAIMDDTTISIQAGVTSLNNFNGITGFDPISIIQRMNIPVLWIYGSLDRSHPSLYDVNILTDLNKSNFQVELLENANHELVDVTTNELHLLLIPTIINWLSSL